ncbi:ABC transporter substrate-binding protein [Chelatococcus asaccharovorans]|uniref:ABC-type nitrate/sulfonate/bicarbonate transport system substrate-binding protein n=1 Tax=Chelatococcus asaccharovorans TaxID=28210 RepID=A0A2V3TYX1_9HYPH|nr:PhnD/SsuA/transferrin family substrate-binding protein [Chelatococcus asaccharovorans]MBS7707803.1 ABC transporter substrate-binding protein [Chelatococcus asaccharovorans]PXW55101.1 ABC-type nitrate/sulfonate/bicarbonate transport system substrate-binding protein [Chelatococcus asaccharovorans]
MKNSHFTRRQLIAAAGAAGVATLAAPRIARAQDATISVGRQPWAAGNSPITQHMIDNKLFEKKAKELGYQLTVDWRDYPSAQPMVEAFVSNNLDLGMWGNTPIIRGLAAKQPWSILNVGEGHFRFVVATRADSGIRNIQDLKGKTIGALLGGDPYNAFSQIILAELGSGNPRDFDIKMINTPTQAQAATIPRGMDAAVLIYPAFLKAQKEAGTVGIVNSFGYTEDHYKGPAGEGAGHLLESVKKSAFYPDGYYLHRSFWMARDSLLSQNPKLAIAFMVAQQEAVTALKAMTTGAISDSVQKYWGLPAELGAKVVEDEVVFRRGWIWPTQGDIGAIVETSKFMVEGKLIPAPLDWKLVLENVAKSAPLMHQAYEMSGSKPPESAFTASDAADVRGLPTWDYKRWTVKN